MKTTAQRLSCRPGFAALNRPAHLTRVRRLNEIDDMTANARAPLPGTTDIDEFMAFIETRPKARRPTCVGEQSN
jgi:hypothetical protein